MVCGDICRLLFFVSDSVNDIDEIWQQISLGCLVDKLPERLYRTSAFRLRVRRYRIRHSGVEWMHRRQRNVLYSPEFVKLLSNCRQNWCVRCNHRLRYKQDTETVRERVIVLILHELWRHRLHTFKLCLYTSGLLRDERQSHISC